MSAPSGCLLGNGKQPFLHQLSAPKADRSWSLLRESNIRDQKRTRRLYQMMHAVSGHAAFARVRNANVSQLN
jgi:hypothetical protein